jgi:membrane-bound lytic murein transglycosylase D
MRIGGAKFVAALTAAVVLAACGSKKTPVIAPTPLPAPPVVEVAPPTPAPPPPQAPDPISLLIAEALRHFDRGQEEMKLGHMVKARAAFDQAVGVLLEAPMGAKGDPRLRSEYEQLLNRISALEAAALRQGDGFSEARSEPAAIDALLAVATFPRPTPTTKVAVAEELETATYDLPVIANEKVLSYVELFQGNLRPFLEDGLTRGSKYLPRILEIFKAEGLPLDLAYVPLIESAFKSTALSRARAKGMWQFQLPTAGDYKLKYNWFIDERSDFEKSTLAAAKHLKMLEKMFKGDWNLVLASYNVGQGRVLGAIKKAKTSDYWTLTSSTKYLPRDTRAYVPMIFASIIIAKNPAQFGFDIVDEAPLAYDIVTVPDALDLNLAAEWAGTTIEVIRGLNPELRRLTTPLGPHQLRVPVGAKELLETKLAAADPSQFVTFQRHSVKSGETLATIARKYKVSRTDLAEANLIKATARVRPGEQLMVPRMPSTSIASTRPLGSSSTAPAPPVSAPRASAPRSTAASPSTTYRVKAGDTLSEIARRFDVTVAELKRWNKLTSNALGIGDRLVIHR